MQKHVNLVDLVKSFPTNIYLQNLASIQKRTSPVKFAHLAEKSGKGSISNVSTKGQTPRARRRQARRRRLQPERFIHSDSLNQSVSQSVSQSVTQSPEGSVIIIIISAPNENSQKASISVIVLAAGSQDRICVNEHQN